MINSIIADIDYQFLQDIAEPYNVIEAAPNVILTRTPPDFIYSSVGGSSDEPQIELSPADLRKYTKLLQGADERRQPNFLEVGQEKVKPKRKKTFSFGTRTLSEFTFNLPGLTIQNSHLFDLPSLAAIAELGIPRAVFEIPTTTLLSRVQQERRGFVASWRVPQFFDSGQLINVTRQRAIEVVTLLESLKAQYPDKRFADVPIRRFDHAHHDFLTVKSDPARSIKTRFERWALLKNRFTWDPLDHTMSLDDYLTKQRTRTFAEFFKDS